jgi:hypothetical protein
MSGPTEAAGLVFFKTYGFKIGMGMLGSTFLYCVLPPLDNSGRFDRKEFAARLAAAGMASAVFSDWFIAMLMAKWPWLQLHDHAAPVYLMVGAPAWWVGRAVALWFRRREGRDVVEMVKEVKDGL